MPRDLIRDAGFNLNGLSEADKGPCNLTRVLCTKVTVQPEEMMKPIEAQHACGLSLKRLKLKASPSSMSDVDFADRLCTNACLFGIVARLVVALCCVVSDGSRIRRVLGRDRVSSC